MLQDKLYLGSRNVVTHRYYDQRLDPGTSTLTRTFVSVLLYSLELLLIERRTRSLQWYGTPSYCDVLPIDINNNIKLNFKKKYLKSYKKKFKTYFFVKYCKIWKI